MQPGEIDPGAQVIIAVVGKKGSGKSKLARYQFNTYPYDALIIDPNGTDRPPEVGLKDSGYVEIHDPPARWPERLRPEGKRLVLYYRADPGSSTFVEDMDAAMGCAYAHGRCLVLHHEMGLQARSNRVPPMTLRTLQSGRHRKVSLIMCMPRPVTVDPLVLGQADLICMFKTQNPDDRKRYAQVTGWDPTDLELAFRELEPFGYLQYDGRIPEPAPGEQNMQLVAYPPLSREELAEVMRGPLPEVA